MCIGNKSGSGLSGGNFGQPRGQMATNQLASMVASSSLPRPATIQGMPYGNDAWTPTGPATSFSSPSPPIIQKSFEVPRLMNDSTMRPIPIPATNIGMGGQIPSFSNGPPPGWGAVGPGISPPAGSLPPMLLQPRKTKPTQAMGQQGRNVFEALLAAITQGRFR